MYENWPLDYRDITRQVLSDLKKVIDIPQEVLDRMAGRDENENLAKALDILGGYREYIEEEYRKSMAQQLSRSLVEAGAELLVPMIERWLKGSYQRTTRLYPARQAPVPPSAGTP